MSIHRSSRKRARSASLLSDTSDEDVVELHPTKTPSTSASNASTSATNWSKTQRSKPIARAAKKKKPLKTARGVPEPTSEDHALIAKDMADAMAVDEQVELDKVAGDDFLKLMESLLDCDGEESGDDMEPADAEEALTGAESASVIADIPVLHC